MTVREKPLTEADWAVRVTDALTVTGWRWCYTKPSKRGDNGAPDVFAVRVPRFMALELKRGGWRGATDEQKQWIRELAASGVEGYVLTFPSQWHRFEELIARPPIQESWTSNSTSATLVTSNNEGTPNP